MAGMVGPMGDRMQFQCVECGEMETFASDRGLLQVLATAVMRAGWRVHWYEVPNNPHGKAPKMRTTWHCPPCAVIDEVKFDEARTTGKRGVQ